MLKIYETENFILEAMERPKISREEGGHVKISPKVKIDNRTLLAPKLAVELMRFTIVAGIAMKKAMARQGIEIGRINYQENANWNPEMHIHLYGRAVDAKIQKYGDPVIPGHKPEFQTLSEEDRGIFAEEIEQLFTEERFQDAQWRLDVDL